MLTAIVGILLGNLLIATLFAPALRRLQQILDKFADIELPHISRWQIGQQMTSEEYRKAEDSAVANFNRLFREYSMAFNSFKKVAGVFVSAILILACVVVWQTPLSLVLRALCALAGVITILGTGWFLQRAVAPTPGQLVSIDFIENNFANLHLDLLFNSAHLHIDFGRMLGSADPNMHFSLSKQLMFSGYRFLMTVSDTTCSRVFFFAYGELGPKINFQQIWTPEISSFIVPLGDFSLADALRQSHALKLCLWLFVPTPKGWVEAKPLHPRFLEEDMTEDMGGQTGVTVLSSNCKWTICDEDVDFEKKSIGGFERWRITRLVVPGATSPQAILQMFKAKIEHCRKIRTGDCTNRPLVIA